MMKKLLILMLVLGMASVANATVIDVVTAGLGSLGNAGTSLDPLELSETIEIKLVLNSNPYPDWPSYDGYLLSIIDVDLHISGPGSLSAGTLDKSGNPVWQKHANLSPFGVVDAPTPNPPYDGIADGLDRIAGTAMTPVGPPVSGSVGPIDLLWDLIIHCDGFGPVVIDLTLYGLNQYSPYSAPDGVTPYPGGWLTMTEADLGDLTIHQIPEPATIALLGMGGLLLLRRRK